MGYRRDVFKELMKKSELLYYEKDVRSEMVNICMRMRDKKGLKNRKVYPH